MSCFRLVTRYAPKAGLTILSLTSLAATFLLTGCASHKYTRLPLDPRTHISFRNVQRDLNGKPWCDIRDVQLDATHPGRGYIVTCKDESQVGEDYDE